MSVEIQGLYMTYLRRGVEVGDPVLKDITLHVKKGEKFGILGPTGAGKTSLMLSFNGLIPRIQPALVKGDIVVDGVDVKFAPVEQVAQHLGLVFANPNLSLVQILVEDDVAFGPANLDLSVEEIQKRVRFAIGATRLKGYEKRSTGDLSGGEMQAVSVAGILAMQTPIMAFDEPLTMLDPVGKTTVIEVIRTLSNEQGLTVIVSEGGNDMDYFSTIVDRIAVLYDGQILRVGTPSEIYSDDELMKKIGIRPPQVTRLFKSLEVSKKSPPIRIEDGIKELKEMIKRKRLGVRKTARKKTKAGKRKTKREPIIHVRNLHHIYPGGDEGIHALKGVDLDIYPGEKIGIIGQNGSGKSTLSYHLVGLLRPMNPDATVIVDGRDVANKKTPLQEVIIGINYAFQDPDAQICQETVWEEMVYGLRLKGYSEEEVERRALEALDLFGLREARDVPLLQASLDQKRFVTIGSLIALEPKILICDEPTNGLDYEGGKKVMKTLMELSDKQGMTAVVITHNMELVAEYTERTIVMKDGRIVLDGPTREVFTEHETLEECFLAAPQVTRIARELEGYGVASDFLFVKEMVRVLRK